MFASFKKINWQRDAIIHHKEYLLIVNKMILFPPQRSFCWSRFNAFTLLSSLNLAYEGQPNDTGSLVHGLGKWKEKFRTGKFRPGIAFTIRTNQFHLPKKECKGLKLVSNMALEKWNLYTNVFLDHSVRKKKKRTIFSDAPLLQWRFSAGMTQKVEFHLLPNRIFGKLFVKGKQPWFTRDRFRYWLRS